MDARNAGSAVGVSARTAAARSSLARSMGTMGVIQSDRTTGTLRFVGRLDGYLTSKSTRSASSVALGYVRANRAAFGLRAPDLRSFRLQRDYVDISGTHHLSWVQRAGGLTVFGQGLHAAVDLGRPPRQRHRRTRAWRARPCRREPSERRLGHRGGPRRCAGGRHLRRSRQRRTRVVPDRTWRPAGMEDRHLREPERDRPLLGRCRHR